jgi:hypothetical protein
MMTVQLFEQNSASHTPRQKILANFHQHLAHFSSTLAIYNLESSLFYVNVIVSTLLGRLFRNLLLLLFPPILPEILHSFKNNSYLLPILNRFSSVRE